MQLYWCLHGTNMAIAYPSIPSFWVTLCTNCCLRIIILKQTQSKKHFIIANITPETCNSKTFAATGDERNLHGEFMRTATESRNKFKKDRSSSFNTAVRADIKESWWHRLYPFLWQWIHLRRSWPLGWIWLKSTSTLCDSDKSTILQQTYLRFFPWKFV